MCYKGTDHVFRTKGFHPRYRVFGGEEGQPLYWDSQFKDYLSECEELEDEVITHQLRRLTTQHFQGKESSFVGMDNKIQVIWEKDTADEFRHVDTEDYDLLTLSPFCCNL